MPIIIDFTLARADNGILTVVLEPPTPISGWAIQATMWRRFDMPLTSGLVTKSCASGFNNVSGINVTNGAQGIMNVSFNPAEVSGLDPGAYAYSVVRTNSGAATTLTEGYRLME